MRCCVKAKAWLQHIENANHNYRSGM